MNANREHNREWARKNVLKNRTQTRERVRRWRKAHPRRVTEASAIDRGLSSVTTPGSATSSVTKEEAVG